MASSQYILILTASSVEFKAVCAHLPDARTVKLNRSNGEAMEGFSAKMGAFEEKSIIAVCAYSGGEHRVFTALNVVLYQYPPALVMFVGIGGGFGPKALIGSVIVSDFIGDHTRSVDGPTGPNYIMKGGKVHDSLLPVAHEIADSDKWIDRLIHPDVVIPDKNEFVRQVIVGRVSAGNVLVETTDSPLNAAISGGAADTLTIEMESAACYECCTLHAIPFIAIRGISDRLSDRDSGKDKYRQPMAAALANAVAFEFLSSYIKSIKSEPEKHDETEVPANFAAAIPTQNVIKSVDTSSQPVEPESANVSWAGVITLKNFAKRPEPRRGQAVTIHARFHRSFQRATEAECKCLRLEYGDAICRKINLIRPQMTIDDTPFGKFLDKVYATGELADWLEDAELDTLYELVARLEFGKTIDRPTMLPLNLRRDLVRIGLYDEQDYQERTIYISGMILLKAKIVKEVN